MGEMQMQRAKYTSEFKEEAVRQVVDKGHSVVDVAKWLLEFWWMYLQKEQIQIKIEFLNINK